ncbi:hypothetical protein C5167_002246 [Papaver somniferum]|uniref:protein-serine/threonine phosphatase n=1 Tax=Papaver somniferum TaxID=3469 RepID=A0A4Y7L0U1_PAPSO|nr:probable protein phosphatase 2C 25 [Papaver somniferum]RZC78048.1 hypothetical protein C5167_002246 [Papaver somniferum]
MSCAVAVSNNLMSTVFSPTNSRVSSSLFCKPSTSSSSTTTSAVPKRHRPARIDIPVVPSSFLALETPKGNDINGIITRREIEVEEEEFSVYCKKGRKAAMEDRYSASVGLLGDPKQAFFGVYDGHGGAKAAEFASKHMENNIMNELSSRGADEQIEEAVKSGYLLTDSEFLKEDVRGGSCSVTALIRNGHLVVSNAGDCRAVISRGGISAPLTDDHKPSRPDEKERIEALGGYVDYVHGGWRLQGTLAVSRGIGDQHLKQWVIADPETKIFRLESDCEFLILASDGLWEKVTNEEAVDVVRALCFDGNKRPLLSACKKIAAMAVSRGSNDDITVMLIKLGNFI